MPVPVLLVPWATRVITTHVETAVLQTLTLARREADVGVGATTIGIGHESLVVGFDGVQGATSLRFVGMPLDLF